MFLEFREKHRSIEKFEPINLPDFTILTGVNGSGKTQLLQALTNGSVHIDSIKQKDIVYFDLMQFRIENESNFNKDLLLLERNNTWNYFTVQSIASIGILKSVLESKKNQCLQLEDQTKIKNISTLKNKSPLDLDEFDFENEEELKKKFLLYQQIVIDIFSNNNIKNNPYGQSIFILSKSFMSFLDEITKEEFREKYVPITLKQNFLPMQMGKIFLDYRMKEHEEFHKSVENHPNEPIPELRKKSDKKCREKYGGFTPWEILNDFLKAYQNFDYVISYPDQFDTNYYSYQSDSSFTSELKNIEKNLSINYDDMSSGESILFSLALCLFKGKSEKVFPKLLLLDEIDASLHPSMINNLLRVIQDVFLVKGTKVILVTHSPTTIAIAPEESIFVVNKEGDVKIEKRDKKDALAILTEGYMTIEEGIKIFDQISKKEISIITEGYNTEYIELALNFFAVSLKDKIEIIKGTEGHSGDTQLRTLFDFFIKVNHDKKVIFVWDCDYRKLFENKNNTFGFVFSQNDSNNIAKRGIENLFDESFFDRFIRTNTDSLGNQERFFDESRKNDFLKHMKSYANENTFRNFKPLFDYISEKIC